MLAIIIPYRASTQPERAQQLEKLREIITTRLPEAFVAVIEQDDDLPFNRGALLNTAIDCMGLGGDAIMCFHDVDLLPQEDILDAYRKPLPPNTVRHIGHAWKRYNSDSYLGGILMIRASDFLEINGFPCDFWGWGGEDDELRDRIQRAKMNIERPTGTIVDLENMTLEQKMIHLKKTNQKCPDKWERREWHKAHPNKHGIYQLDYQVTQAILETKKWLHFKVKIFH